LRRNQLSHFLLVDSQGRDFVRRTGVFRRKFLLPCRDLFQTLLHSRKFSGDGFDLPGERTGGLGRLRSDLARRGI
jgi:hypothetical protein